MQTPWPQRKLYNHKKTYRDKINPQLNTNIKQPIKKLKTMENTEPHTYDSQKHTTARHENHPKNKNTHKNQAWTPKQNTQKTTKPKTQTKRNIHQEKTKTEETDQQIKI